MHLLLRDVYQLLPAAAPAPRLLFAARLAGMDVCWVPGAALFDALYARSPHTRVQDFAPTAPAAPAAPAAPGGKAMVGQVSALRAPWLLAAHRLLAVAGCMGVAAYFAFLCVGAVRARGMRRALKDQ